MTSNVVVALVAGDEVVACNVWSPAVEPGGIWNVHAKAPEAVAKIVSVPPGDPTEQALKTRPVDPVVNVTVTVPELGKPAPTRTDELCAGPSAGQAIITGGEVTDDE